MQRNIYFNNGKRIGRGLIAALALSAIALVLGTDTVNGQSVGISETSPMTPSGNSLLEIRMNTTPKGLLIPRITEVNRTTLGASLLASPLVANTSVETERGMLVFQRLAGTDPMGFYFWNGSAWVRILDSGSASGWLLNGNGSTTPGTHYLGTSDAQDLRIKTNNADAFNITSTGKRLLAYQNGTAALPLYSWSADGGTMGIYRIETPAKALGFSTEGLEGMRIEADGKLRLPNDANGHVGAERQIYVGTTDGSGSSVVHGKALTLKAGDRLNHANSPGKGGDLILEAGSGNKGTVVQTFNPGGDVIVRAGRNLHTGGNPAHVTDGGGYIRFQTALQNQNNAGSLHTTRMSVHPDGKVTINDLINAGNPRIVTSNSTGQLGTFAFGTSNQVLKMNSAGDAVEWGAPAVTSLSIPANTGDMLYFNGTNWIVLPVPGVSAGGAGVYWALTLPNPGTGTPSWAATTAFTTTGDDMGDHTATTDIDLNTNDLTGTGNIDIDGKIKTNGMNETSDLRLKKDIVNLTDALNRVLKMRGVSYNWRTDEFPERNFADAREVGVIAQEIEELLPEVVQTDKRGYKSVQYGHIVPLLIEAIKEQQAIIDGQQAELTSLKGFKEELEILKASVELISEHIRTSQK